MDKQSGPAATPEGAGSEYDPARYETVTRELERIIQRLSHEEMPLHEKVKGFEQGVLYSREALAILDAAQAKLETLTPLLHDEGDGAEGSM